MKHCIVRVIALVSIFMLSATSAALTQGSSGGSATLSTAENEGFYIVIPPDVAGQPASASSSPSKDWIKLGYYSTTQECAAALQGMTSIKVGDSNGKTVVKSLSGAAQCAPATVVE
jgi:hypothetical protein